MILLQFFHMIQLFLFQETFNFYIIQITFLLSIWKTFNWDWKK